MKDKLLSKASIATKQCTEKKWTHTCRMNAQPNFQLMPSSLLPLHMTHMHQNMQAIEDDTTLSPTPCCMDPRADFLWSQSRLALVFLFLECQKVEQLPILPGFFCMFFFSFLCALTKNSSLSLCHFPNALVQNISNASVPSNHEH